METLRKDQASTDHKTAERTVMTILLTISFSHLLNDTIQSLIPAVYPLLKQSFRLSFAQIGLITLTFQLTASVLQPFVGLFADRRPAPYSLAVGMGFTLTGLILLAMASSYPAILVAAGLVGVGSSVFHPEASRVAHMASGGKHGFAQSLFQVGGNAGSSLGPLLAAVIVVPYGQVHILWFSLVAFLGILLLWRVGAWYAGNLVRIKARTRSKPAASRSALPRRKVAFSLGILIALIFSKYFYLASLGSYYTFYLIHKLVLAQIKYGNYGRLSFGILDGKSIQRIPRPSSEPSCWAGFEARMDE